MTQRTMEGRGAVVTGASSGIGRAIAERLGGAGAHVVLSGRDEAALAEAVDRITAGGGSARAIAADLRDPAAVEALVAAVVADVGQLDVFVNNAGVSYLGTVLDGTVESWRNMLETNVLALLVGCQAAVRSMRATGNRGHIVNVSSVAAHSPDSGVYGATKHAVNVISRTLRAELANDPIRLTTIMPGLVATNIGRNIDPAVLQGLVAASGMDVEVVPGERLPDHVIDGAQSVLAEIMLSPADVADAVLYALNVPEDVDITELVIRPNKDFDL